MCVDVTPSGEGPVEAAKVINWNDSVGEYDVLFFALCKYQSMKIKSNTKLYIDTLKKKLISSLVF